MGRPSGMAAAILVFAMTKYPTMAQVETADPEQLLRWSRYLPSPDDEHRPILTRILARQSELGGITPEISKRVGWDGP